jgi:hypothetical protein
VCRLFQSDPLLVSEAGTAFQGKLLFPWGHGVALTNITRKAFDSTDLGQVLPPDRVICQDEMVESVDPEALSEAPLGNVRRGLPVFAHPPANRSGTLAPLPRDPGDAGRARPQAGGRTRRRPLPDIVRVMDLHQEQLARSIGEGHRVIHGVAGSGKTMILGYRGAASRPGHREAGTRPLLQRRTGSSPGQHDGSARPAPERSRHVASTAGAAISCACITYRGRMARAMNIPSVSSRP